MYSLAGALRRLQSRGIALLVLALGGRKDR